MFAMVHNPSPDMELVSHKHSFLSSNTIAPYKKECAESSLTADVRIAPGRTRERHEHLSRSAHEKLRAMANQ